MKKCMNRTAVLNTKSGFTLIEILLVVVIIGILAAVAIPAFMKYIRRSKTVEATMNVRKLFDSSVAYFAAEHASKTGDKCPPNATNFTADTWSALNFSVDDPFYFRYQYDSAGVETAANFQAWAYGDLDCDTTLSTYQRSGSVLADRSVTGGSGLFSKNEIE